VTSVERASSPPKYSYRSSVAMHLQEAENAPNLCAANKDLMRGCCDAKKPTTHLGAAESPQLAREQRPMKGSCWFAYALTDLVDVTQII
jgi:hypothetical protein